MSKIINIQVKRLSDEQCLVDKLIALNKKAVLPLIHNGYH